MPLLSWKQEYSVSDVELDSHHQRLFFLLNSLFEKVMSSAEVDCLRPMIDELSDYTKYHFSSEEQHMRDKGFRGIDGHIAQHREFTNSIEILKSHYNGNDMEVSQELIVVLGSWLLSHVLKDDMQYSSLTSAGNETASQANPAKVLS